MSFISPDVALIARCSADGTLHLSLSGELGIACSIRRGIDPERLRGIMRSLAGSDDANRADGQSAADRSESGGGERRRGNGARVSDLSSTWAGAWDVHAFHRSPAVAHYVIILMTAAKRAAVDLHPLSTWPVSPVAQREEVDITYPKSYTPVEHSPDLRRSQPSIRGVPAEE